jgi:mRNA interferase YafQ
MREIKRTPHFRNDLKRLARSGVYDLSALFAVLADLANDKPLPEKYRDHVLSGQWKHCRDCHIHYDWVLIYQLQSCCLILIRTGSHQELFK